MKLKFATQKTMFSCFMNVPLVMRLHLVRRISINNKSNKGEVRPIRESKIVFNQIAYYSGPGCSPNKSIFSVNCHQDSSCYPEPLEGTQFQLRLLKCNHYFDVEQVSNCCKYKQ